MSDTPQLRRAAVGRSAKFERSEDVRSIELFGGASARRTAAN